MATKILIPTPLRPFTDRKDAVEVDGKTEDTRYLQKEQTPIAAGDTVSIIPSVAGGAPAAEAPAALPELTRDDFKRYSRHLILPEVGVQGQQKLKAAKILCIGAGGLGSPVALYLAAAQGAHRARFGRRRQGVRALQAQYA